MYYLQDNDKRGILEPPAQVDGYGEWYVYQISAYAGYNNPNDDGKSEDSGCCILWACVKL